MDNLKKKLYNYSVAAPSESWANIVGVLDKTDTVSLPPRKISPYLIPMAAALLILVFSAVFFVNQKNPAVQISKGEPERFDKGMATFSSPDTNLLASNKNETQTREKLNNIIGNTYITITSVDGKPVRISSKAASLIVSSDNQFPAKTVWNAKVNRWKAKMLNNPVTPTTTNFLDIADLTEVLTDRSNSDN
ncbi:MAG: hypothetical protein ABIR81_09205 [Ginsengibacter sp.]